ncbi:class I SAM-dependent methyltransferase [Candidatus Pelagibacter sp.]|nr:class I SAM-dependent methyltransferase [Candidatus Pelagibacter sp.]
MINLKKLIDDYKGKGKNIHVPNSNKLTGQGFVSISKYSGLVSVTKRRSSKEIAKDWNNNFGLKKNYNSKNPAVVSRHIYTAETIKSFLDLRDKSIIDLGAGEGNFLKIFSKKKFLKKISAVEPSSKNCKKITSLGIKAFNETIEDFALKSKEKFDIATLVWTLCNCSDPMQVIKSSHNILKKNGFIVIAEGSRIMVPFKKPIQMYFSKKQKPDLHPFHFSKNSLLNLLILNKFRPVFVNRYIDNDNLVVIAKKIDKIESHKIKLENYKKVKNFFIEWYQNSKKYKKEIIV